MNARSRAIRRWICVLPAAVVGGLAVEYALGLVGRLLLAGANQPGSGVGFYLGLLLFHVPRRLGFVALGAAVAPRSRGIVAVALAVVAILMSLVVHIVGQSNPGVVNFSHFGAESVGAAAGAACLYYADRRRSAAMGENAASE